MGFVFGLAFILVAIGELADKSQLLALTLATRYRAWQVIVGIFIATLAVHMASTLAGQVAGALIPPGVLPLISGLMFVGFGIWTLRGDSVDESDAEKGRGRLGPVLATAVAFFFAELGDKTQIMTVTIAADPGQAATRLAASMGGATPPWLSGVGAAAASLSAVQTFWMVTLGSTLGMVAADALAILVGVVLGRHLPERLLRVVSAWLFIAFGIVTVASALVGPR